MIEAMACGTPVLAFAAGSVPEVIDSGVTGMVVDSMQAAIAALPHVISLDRSAVRRRFEERFSATRMAQDYVSLYMHLLHRENHQLLSVAPRLETMVGQRLADQSRLILAPASHVQRGNGMERGS
jgi:hypothetical protein